MTARLVEWRSYRLHPGCGARFDTLVQTQSLPLLRAAGMDVVLAGPSAHTPDAYLLVRAFADAADLQARQDAFYASAAWRQGPRQAILDCIINSLDVQRWLTEAALAALRPVDGQG